MFIAVLRQKGSGCDYSIECGTKVVQLKAEDWPSAMTEAEGFIRNGYDEGVFDVPGEDGCEREAESIWVYEFAAAGQVDLEAVYGQARETHARKKAREEVEGERAEFNRLFEKFGKTE